MKRMIKEGAWFSMKLELTMNLNYSSNLHIISVSHIKSRIGGTREALEEVPRGIGRVEIAKCVHEALSLSLSRMAEWSSYRNSWAKQSEEEERSQLARSLRKLRLSRAPRGWR